MGNELAGLRRTVVRLLKRYRTAEEHDRTAILRQTAETLFEVRSHFARADGRPDWKGRTFAYRVWVGEACSDAGIRREDQPTTLAAVRYHLGAVLRERLDDDTLAEYDLIPQTPRERATGRRQARSALLNALTGREAAGGVLVALSGAGGLLDRVEPESLDELDDEGAQAADEILAGVERRARSFRRRIAKR